MQEIEKIIDWFQSKKGKVTYSMSYRYGINNSNGKESYDCSSSIYYACINAFNKVDDWVRSTSTLPKFLENLGFYQVVKNGQWTAKRGDIIIWQKNWGVSGATAHTGIFTDNTHIMHCNYKNNGITEDTEQSLNHLYKYNWVVYRLKDVSKWVEDNKGKWYRYFDGSYPYSKWCFIDNKWFYFDNEGYCYCDKWLKWQNDWYYFNSKGEMIKNEFLTIGEETFYFDNDGICTISEVKEINGKSYAFNFRGALIKNKKIDNNGVIE